MSKKAIPTPPRKGEIHNLVDCICTNRGVPYNTAVDVWKQAHKFNTWKLDTFMANPPSRSTIYRVKSIVEFVASVED